jgi:hypothetical protein
MIPQPERLLVDRFLLWVSSTTMQPQIRHWFAARRAALLAAEATKGVPFRSRTGGVAALHPGLLAIEAFGLKTVQINQGPGIEDVGNDL